MTGLEEEVRAARQRLASEQVAYAREAIDAGTTLVQAIHTRALDAAIDAFESAVRRAAEQETAEALRHARETLARLNETEELIAAGKYSVAAAFRMVRLSAGRTVAALEMSRR